MTDEWDQICGGTQAEADGATTTDEPMPCNCAEKMPPGAGHSAFCPNTSGPRYSITGGLAPMSAEPSDAAKRVAAMIRTAIARGEFVVCLTRCEACQWGCHYDPPTWHSWAEREDVAHAKATGQKDPSDSRCGCDCAKATRRTDAIAAPEEESA